MLLRISGKRNKERALPLTQPTLAMLREVCKVHRSTRWLFSNRQGPHHLSSRIARRAFNGARDARTHAVVPPQSSLRMWPRRGKRQAFLTPSSLAGSAQRDDRRPVLSKTVDDSATGGLLHGPGLVEFRAEFRSASITMSCLEDPVTNSVSLRPAASDREISLIGQLSPLPETFNLTSMTWAAQDARQGQQALN